MNRSKIKRKKDTLLLAINGFDSLIVAFSGGVDSSFLLAATHEIIKENLVAVTAVSPIHPERERKAAIEFARNLGVNHILLQSREMSQADFMANRKDRCYICKKNLFGNILKIASDMEIKNIAHGANVDDLEDFRPGFAAAREMGVAAPMVDAGLTKEDIRLLSKEMNLAVWNKPATACLATRIPYGTPITRKALKMVEEAENAILSLGFAACRVRFHGKVARIEVSLEDFERILDEIIRKKIVGKFREIGFSHISLDLEGYIQGSLNR